MKKKIFLSFRPEFFRPILYDIKKYEYRKRFCKEPTTAYLYLSAPVQEVIGIMELGKPIDIPSKYEQYKNIPSISNRILKCIEGKEIFAIPIESLILFKNPVSISTLKEIDSKFSVPRCYLNIEKFHDVYKYLSEQTLFDKVEFVNQHNKLYEDNFCMTCKEMELTEEFVKKDKYYTQESMYQIIKSGYINNVNK